MLSTVFTRLDVAFVPLLWTGSLYGGFIIEPLVKAQGEGPLFRMVGTLLLSFVIRAAAAFWAVRTAMLDA